MTTTIALFGAGGKMGCRIVDNLLKDRAFALRTVEVAPAGVARLAERGVRPCPAAEAVRGAEVVILAVPDTRIGEVARTVVPMLDPGAMVMCLDPAAPLAGELPERPDIAFVVAHPCHPPVVNDEVDPAARRDFFGGIAAKQHIVCALMRGHEVAYACGERVARAIFAPVMDCHRVTVEQMAILEPALSETVAATLMVVIREALEESVRRGVPERAARDFLLGHLNVDIGILFGFIDARFSDGARMAVERGKRALIKDGWRELFAPAEIMREVRAIVAAGRP
jgi:hypothetical protein